MAMEATTITLRLLQEISSGVDRVLGPGAAERSPELLGSLVQSAVLLHLAKDTNASAAAKGLSDLPKAVTEISRSIGRV